MNVPSGASEQWAYKANVATSKAPSGKGWARFLSSNGWPKIPPKLQRLVGAEVESAHTGRRGRVLRGSPCGWLVIEDPDGAIWTCTPGGLLFGDLPAKAKTAGRGVSARDAELKRLRARIQELQAENMRLASLLAGRGRRAQAQVLPEQTGLEVFA